MKAEGVETQMRYIFLQTLDIVCINKIPQQNSIEARKSINKNINNHINDNNDKNLSLSDIVIDIELPHRESNRMSTQSSLIESKEVPLNTFLTGNNNMNTIENENQNYNENKIGKMESINDIVGIEEQLWKKTEIKSNNNNSIPISGSNSSALGHNNKHTKKWRKFESSNLMDRQQYPMKQYTSNKSESLQIINNNINNSTSTISNVKLDNNTFLIEPPEDEILQSKLIRTQIRLKTATNCGNNNRPCDMFLSHTNSNILLEWFDVIKYHTVDIINSNSD